MTHRFDVRHILLRLASCLPPRNAALAVDESKVSGTFNLTLTNFLDSRFLRLVMLHSISCSFPVSFFCLAGPFVYREGYVQRVIFPAQTRLGRNSVICFGRDKRLVSQPREPGRGRASNRRNHGFGEK